MFINYSHRKLILYSDVLTCYLASFIDFRIPFRTPHHVWLSCLLRFFLTEFLRLFLFLMTLTVLKSTSQAFYRMSLNMVLHNVFLRLDWSCMLLGKR